jgi:pimeloyl-ACP methyl ester carboxylesterase
MARVGGYGRAVADYVRNYPLAPRYRRSERTWVTAADGVRLAVARLDGPPDAVFTVVLLHGFVNSSRTPRVQAFARRLAARAHVLVPDLRGHRASGGECTLGLTEPADITAVIGAAPAGLPVVTIGTSLGGATALLHAGLHGGVAGVVSVSSPAWWGSTDRAGAARVYRFVSSPAGRRVAAVLLRTRIAECGDPVPDVDSVVAAISPAFTVIVHDPDDHYFGAEHAERLFAAAREPKAQWWYPGAGHGTDLLTPDLADRMLDEVSRRLVR